MSTNPKDTIRHWYRSRSSTRSAISTITSSMKSAAFRSMCSATIRACCFPSRAKKPAHQMEVVHLGLRRAHTHAEAVAIVTEILRVPCPRRASNSRPDRVEGGSTAKLSLATNLIGRKPLVDDSLEGLPDVDEAEKTSSTGANTRERSRK